MERDSHTLVQRQIEDDLQRNAGAFLFYDATLDVEANEQAEPIALCEACNQHTFAERDGELVMGTCDHCGEDFSYSYDDARVVSQ